MKRSGSADLPLHYGHVPQWLMERMARLGLAISESIVSEYGTQELLRRLSDPFWFQSFGAVMGMDWHSSGITTSVLGALKRAINPVAKSLGIYICGGKGKFSTQTPGELLRLAESIGIDGTELVRCSKLSAKVDNTAIQDGFQLYTHNFIVDATGKWTVVQQGMHAASKTARRYHWHSANIHSFVEEPHSGICGVNQGTILNLTDTQAAGARQVILQLVQEDPTTLVRDFQRLVMPSHHEVTAADVNLKQLGSILWMAHDLQPQNFESLLLLRGVGPRTVQSLALVSEVIHGTPARFRDPARFSFAHGGKDGHPFPVPVKVYDETITTLQRAVEQAKLGYTERSEAIKKLHGIAVRAADDFVPDEGFNQLVQHERDNAWRYGGKTVFGDSRAPGAPKRGVQLKLF